MQARISGARAGTPGRQRAGTAMVAVVIALTGLLVLGSIFHQLAVRVAVEQAANVDERRAFYLADTALSEAMTAVRAGASGSVGSLATPAYFGGGVFWVQATDMGANRTRLLATALCGSGRAALEAEVQMVFDDPLFKAVLNSKDTLTLNSSVMVDSFDSELGSYASQAVNSNGVHVYANANGDVSSNMGIVLNSNATAFGDAIPGPGYSVVFNTGAYVSGSITPAPVAFSFPPIQVPAVAGSSPLVVPDNGSYSLPAGIHGFGALQIGTKSTLVVHGPAKIVCTDFTGGKLGKLVIDATAGPVTIYVKGAYQHISGFEAQPAGSSPMALAFMLTKAQDVTFPSKSKISGAYYGPATNFTFTSANEIWGAFAGNRIDMSSSTKFHFDESLMKHWDNQTSGGSDPLDVLVWRRAAVAPALLLRDRRDPFAVLGVAKAALLSPAKAWGP
jgi:hypothetical protein